ELTALLGPLPVVSLEKNVESQLPPDRDFVVRQRRNGRIDEPDIANDFEPLDKRNNRRHALVLNEHLVSHDASDQIIAVVFGTAQQVEMSDMKEIECTGRVADTDHGEHAPLRYAVTIGAR